MSPSPLPSFRPGEHSFRLQLEPLPGDGPRQFRPLRVGGFLISIQASDATASLPPGTHPPEDVDAFEVAIFTTGADGEPPHTVSPFSHPHLFRDERWARAWVPVAAAEGGTYWSGRFIPTDVVSDLLTCLWDPDAYTHLLTQRRG